MCVITLARGTCSRAKAVSPSPLACECGCAVRTAVREEACLLKASGSRRGAPAAACSGATCCCLAAAQRRGSAARREGEESPVIRLRLRARWLGTSMLLTLPALGAAHQYASLAEHSVVAIAQRRSSTGAALRASCTCMLAQRPATAAVGSPGSLYSTGALATAVQ